MFLFVLLLLLLVLSPSSPMMSNSKTTQNFNSSYKRFYGTQFIFLDSVSAIASPSNDSSHYSSDSIRSPIMKNDSVALRCEIFSREIFLNNSSTCRVMCCNIFCCYLSHLRVLCCSSEIASANCYSYCDVQPSLKHFSHPSSLKFSTRPCPAAND
jgi:hypothetical protein